MKTFTVILVTGLLFSGVNAVAKAETAQEILSQVQAEQAINQQTQQAIQHDFQQLGQELQQDIREGNSGN